MRTLSQSLVIQNLKADHELSSTRWGCTTRKYKALVVVVVVVVEQERGTKTPHWLRRRAATGAAAAMAAASEREQAGRKDAQTRSCCCDEKLRKGKNKSKLGVCYIRPQTSSSSSSDRLGRSFLTSCARRDNPAPLSFFSIYCCCVFRNLCPSSSRSSIHPSIYPSIHPPTLTDFNRL
jgi:hypothetical protein